MKAAPNSRNYRPAPICSTLQNPEREPSLPCLDIRGDETDVVYARTTHDVNRASNICKLDRIIALHEGRFFGALLEDVFQARAQPVPGNFVLVNQDISARCNLHNDR